MGKSSHLKILEFPIGASPKERGRIRGETMRPFIIDEIETWKYLHMLESPNLDFHEFIDRFINNTKYIEAVRKWTPHLLEEVVGISEGSGIDFNTIFCLSCADEIGVPEMETIMDNISKPPQGTQTHTSGCSTLGCFKENRNPALLGQNLDTNESLKNYVVLLDLKEENGHKSYIQAFPGWIGAIGLNNSPLGVVVNTIYKKSSIDGLPVQFILRKILEQSNLNEAIKFLKTVKHAAAHNYMLGDSEKIVNFECSANKISQFFPYDGARRLYHTNHALVNDDVIPNFVLPKLTENNSMDRFKYLEFRLKDPSKTITFENIKQILSSHIGPICQHEYGKILEESGEQFVSLTPMWGSTCVSIVYKLSKPPELYIAVGNPCINDYERFTF